MQLIILELRHKTYRLEASFMPFVLVDKTFLKINSVLWHVSAMRSSLWCAEPNLLVLLLCGGIKRVDNKANWKIHGVESKPARLHKPQSGV